MAVNLHYYVHHDNGSFSHASEGEDADDILGEYSYDAFNLVVLGFLGSVVNISGFVLNIVVLIVMSRLYPKSAVMILLMGVAYSDLVVLLLGQILVFLPRAFGYMESMRGFVNFVEYDYRYMYPLQDAALIANAWFLVVLAIERFIVIACPARRSELMSRRRVVVAVIVIVVVALAFDVPKFFEYHTITHHDPTPHDSQLRIESSRLHNDQLFKWIYMFAIDLLVRMLIPFLVLLIFLFLLRKKLRDFRLELEGAPLKERAKGKMTCRVTIIAIVLFCGFVIVQLPFLVLAVLHATHDESKPHPHYGRFVNAALFLQAVNAASKFYVYVAMSTNFREELKSLFTCAGKEEREGEGEREREGVKKGAGKERGLSTIEEDEFSSERKMSE